MSIDTAPAAQELRRMCEQLFISARDTLLLMVTPRLIREITAGGSALEVRYSSVQAFHVLGRPVDVTRLLIPLTGRFAEALILYAGAAGRGSAPPQFANLQTYRADGFVYVRGAGAEVAAILTQLGLGDR
jgi:hypothetical protein